MGFYSRGSAYFNLRNYELMSQDIENMKRLKSGFYGEYHLNALYLASLGQTEQAIIVNNKLIKLKPDFAVAYNNRGS